MTVHQKVNVLIFLIYAQKKGGFEENIKFDYSFVFFCLHLLIPTFETSLKFYYNNISSPWDLAFVYHSTSLVSPTQNLLDHVSQ